MKLVSKYPTKAILTLLLLFFILMSFSTFAGGGKAKKPKSVKVRGVVLDQEGTPIRNAAVDIYEGDHLVAEILTDKNGNYQYKVNDQANFVIEVRKRCYQAESVDMERAQSEDGKKVYGYLMQVNLDKVEKAECDKMEDQAPKATAAIYKPSKF